MAPPRKTKPGQTARKPGAGAKAGIPPVSGGVNSPPAGSHHLVNKVITEVRKSLAREAKSKISSYAYETRQSSHVSATGRAVAGTSHPTVQPTTMDYKTGTYRLHHKGVVDPQGKSSGIALFLTRRSGKAWTQGLKDARDHLHEELRNDRDLINPFGDHFAEISHLIAGSLYGANDALNAVPASIHQNTEVLAIEEGVKKNASLKDLRVKVTGYVHADGPEAGWLKAARYKVYLGGKKVFDHVTMGERGNISQEEVRSLRKRVTELSPSSPEVARADQPPGGLGTAPPPTLEQAKRGQLNSVHSTFFTHLKKPDGKFIHGTAAKEYVDAIYRKYKGPPAR